METAVWSDSSIDRSPWQRLNFHFKRPLLRSESRYLFDIILVIYFSPVHWLCDQEYWFVNVHIDRFSAILFLLIVRSHQQPSAFLSNRIALRCLVVIACEYRRRRGAEEGAVVHPAEGAHITILYWMAAWGWRSSDAVKAGCKKWSQSVQCVQIKRFREVNAKWEKNPFWSIYSAPPPLYFFVFCLQETASVQLYYYRGESSHREQWSSTLMQRFE